MADKWLRKNPELQNGIIFPYNATQTMQADYYGWSFWLRQQIGSSFLFGNLYREPIGPIDFDYDPSFVVDKDKYISYGWRFFANKIGNNYQLSVEYGCGTYTQLSITFDTLFDYISLYHIYISLDMYSTTTKLYVNSVLSETKNNYIMMGTPPNEVYTYLNGRLQSHPSSYLEIGSSNNGPFYYSSSFYIDELSVYDGAQANPAFLADLYNSGSGKKRTHDNFFTYSGASRGFYLNLDDADNISRIESYDNGVWTTIPQTTSYETLIEGGVPFASKFNQNYHLDLTETNEYTDSGYDEIVISNDDSINITSTTFSIEIWAKSSVNSIWFITKQSTPGYYLSPGWSVGLDASGRISLYCADVSSGAEANLISSYVGLNDNLWHHYILYVDSMENGGIYIDGFKDESASFGTINDDPYHPYPENLYNNSNCVISAINIACFAIYNEVVTESFARGRHNEGYGLKLTGDENGLQYGINCDEGFNEHLYNVKHTVPYGIANSDSLWAGGGIPFPDNHKYLSLNTSSLISIYYTDTEIKNVLNVTSRMTICMWLKFTEIASNGFSIFSHNPEHYSTNGWRIQVLPPSDYVYAPSTTNISFQVNNGVVDVRSEIIPDICNGWHHWAFVFDNSNSSYCYVYIDGVDRTLRSSPYPKTAIVSTTYSAEQDQLNFHASGTFSIDDFRTYNKSFSAIEIGNVYNHGVGSRPFTTDSIWTENGSKGFWINFDRARVVASTTYLLGISQSNTGGVNDWHSTLNKIYSSGPVSVVSGGVPFHKKPIEEVYNMTAFGSVDNFASRGSHSGGFY